MCRLNSESPDSMSLIEGMHDIVELFAQQEGLASTTQLYKLKVGKGLIRQRIATGEWERIDQRVIGVASTPVTWRRQVWAALLSAGDTAAVSGATAARLHGFDGFDRNDQLHITTFRRRHHTALSGVTIHRSGALTADQCVDVDGLRCVSKPIALLQIAASHGRDAAAKALDGMLRDGSSTIWIERVVSQWRRRGVVGPATVLELINERVDSRLPRSWFQRLAKSVLSTRHLDLVDEHPVRLPDGTLLAELDLAIPNLQIGVECQSWQWHSTPGARARDAQRKRRLRLVGWELVEVWWTDLERIDEIVEELTVLIDRQTQLLPSFPSANAL